MTEQYLKIPVILFKLKMSPVERYILALAISFGGSTYASNQALADLFGVSRQCVIDAVKKLKERKFIDCGYKKNGRTITLSSQKTLLLQLAQSSQETLQSSQVTLPEVVKKLGASSQETLPNSKDIEKSYSKSIVKESEAFRLAEHLLSKILFRKPDFKKPNLERWSVAVERMIRLDARKPETIEKVIDWAQSDDFWQNNILSTDNLRKQFDKLELGMEKHDNRTAVKSGYGKPNRNNQPAGQDATGTRKPFIR